MPSPDYLFENYVANHTDIPEPEDERTPHIYHAPDIPGLSWDTVTIVRDADRPVILDDEDAPTN